MISPSTMTWKSTATKAAKSPCMTQKGELLFYLVSPTNISVLSYVNIEIKIRHLMMVLSALPDIEIICTDSSECFDDNKA